ncbi:hypothetical protein BCV69DRAFT_301771 [Microstroma glucosiphilum]|uniref:Glycosyltransferase 2-like domain-containing protein n=1 Tax=Pseudomicrostroma glucosiphilum TaxID=1684307 RepID=A0A316TWQ2_9BASI|nr:hypothetical protein BCV69DRAFT_301771 [Pseudomicrostroma glucosiphilum]PWN17747.1 hypothetical protein BCV69DRAFT_301771 [Pseudomicrostroma glucosiphilum]
MENKVTLRSSKRRPRLVRLLYYGMLLAMIYFCLIGRPVWYGVLPLLWNHFRQATAPVGYLIFSIINAIWVGFPIVLGRFEPPARAIAADVDPLAAKVTRCPHESNLEHNTALLIPCYKAEKSLPNTIRAALRHFRASSIFILDNGNTEKATDGTPDVAALFGVNYIFVPVGSKIGAEFVGVHHLSIAAFDYVMVIDDDVELPENLTLATKRFRDAKVGCVGYTIRSVGTHKSCGTAIQQLQDLEYRLSGLRHCFGAKWGSATFPHGAIILWRRQTLADLFRVHPGFKISEDLFFGLKCRESGHYVDFTSALHVPTETPPYLFGPRADGLWTIWAFLWSTSKTLVAGADVSRKSDLESAAGIRGGYGEMTVFKQRYTRWAFMHCYALGPQIWWLLTSWNLGWREPVAKVLGLQDVLATLFMLVLPFMLPCTLYYNATLTGKIIAINSGIGLLAALAFNSFHLHQRPEGRIAWHIIFASVPYRLVLRCIQVAAVYRGMILYGVYFGARTWKLHSDPLLSLMVIPARMTRRSTPLTGHGRPNPTSSESLRDIP